MARIPIPAQDDDGAPPWVEGLRQAILVLAGNQTRMIEALAATRTRLDASDARLAVLKEDVGGVRADLSRLEDALTARTEGEGLKALIDEMAGVSAALGALSESNVALGASVDALAVQIDGAAISAAARAAAEVRQSPGLPPRTLVSSDPILPGAAAARRGRPTGGG